MTVRPAPLRVALVSPPWYALPPEGYGGIEAMCAMLADGLVARGHHVITIGSGPSGTNAEHLSTYAEPPSHLVGGRWPEAVHAALAARILADLDVDVVHDHCLAGPLTARSRPTPTIVTAHYTMRGDPGWYYQALADDVELVAISEAQRRLAPDLPWLTTVHNSLVVDDAPFYPSRGDHAVFLGRMSPDKGVAEAIDVARKAGRRLVLAGKCTQLDERRYFEEAVRPRLGPDVEWIGELSSTDKWKFLGEAACLLFPITWDEPFGMVMIEAMAAGTPVVAVGRGSVPEVVVDGVTGFVRDELDDLVPTFDLLDTIDPVACRAHVKASFDLPRMIEGYEAAYRAALASPRVAMRRGSPTAFGGRPHPVTDNGRDGVGERPRVPRQPDGAPGS